MSVSSLQEMTYSSMTYEQRQSLPPELQRQLNTKAKERIVRCHRKHGPYWSKWADKQIKSPTAPVPTKGFLAQACLRHPEMLNSTGSLRSTLVMLAHFYQEQKADESAWSLEQTQAILNIASNVLPNTPQNLFSLLAMFLPKESDDIVLEETQIKDIFNVLDKEWLDKFYREGTAKGQVWLDDHNENHVHQ
jgi:hypothetical protein